jgi:fucokinase
LNKIEKSSKQNFEWVEANCPARLDLSGGWYNNVLLLFFLFSYFQVNKLIFSRSDTPPITYECQGGSCVTNMAILVNGKKPIGSKARIINQVNKENNFFIKIVMQDSSDNDETSNQLVFEFNELNDFKDYNKPQAVACLMKAVFIFTKLIELNDEKKRNLNEQLKEKLNGSLQLHTWTGLPQGNYKIIFISFKNFFFNY